MQKNKRYLCNCVDLKKKIFPFPRSFEEIIFIRGVRRLKLIGTEVMSKAVFFFFFKGRKKERKTTTLAGFLRQLDPANIFNFV